MFYLNEKPAKNPQEQKAVDEIEIINVPPGTEYIYTLLPYENLIENKSPDFAKQIDRLLTLTPSKKDIGQHSMHTVLHGMLKKYQINVLNPPVDSSMLEAEISKILGTKQKDFGVYVQDLTRNQTINVNGNEVFAPASMAKVAMAVLVLRDIDAGKYSLDTTYPIQDSLLFTSGDSLSLLPAGTEVTISQYLEDMIIISSNTAWYHLNAFLGGSYEVVNQRTIDELNVNPLFLDPLIATPVTIGKVLIDLYNAETLSQESSEYLINLMKNAVESNREGIGSVLPAGVEFANKVGFLATETDLSYMDSAIVFSVTTDYVLVIMNKDTDWTTALNYIKQISEVVYNYLKFNEL